MSQVKKFNIKIKTFVCIKNLVFISFLRTRLFIHATLISRLWTLIWLESFPIRKFNNKDEICE